MSATLKRLPTIATVKSSPSIDAIVEVQLSQIDTANDLQRIDDLTCDSLPESSTVHHMTPLPRTLVKQAKNFSGTRSENLNNAIILWRFLKDSVDVRKNIKRF